MEGRLNGRLLHNKQTGRDINLFLASMKFVITNLGPNECDFNIYSGADLISNDFVPLSVSEPASYDILIAVAIPLIVTKMTGAGYGYTMSAPDVLYAGMPVSRSFSNPSLAVNTARQASTTRDTFVSATVDITASLSLTTGQKGTVTLQYADDSGFTTNLKTAQGSSNGNTGTLAIGLNLGQVVSAAVSGIIPAGKYYRLLTAQNTGTPTFGTPAIQEVLL